MEKTGRVGKRGTGSRPQQGNMMINLTQIRAYFKANRTKLNQHLTNSKSGNQKPRQPWGREF